MEHIKQHDWCTSGPDIEFVSENDLDSCVTEKILRNIYVDPLATRNHSDDEEHDIDWAEILRNCTANKDIVEEKQHIPKQRHTYVACLRGCAPYPKLSSLTAGQHIQLLKVICSNNPQVLPMHYVLRPTKTDQKLFQELMPKYVEEQIEYMEWAKSLWTSTHCTRALRPKPTVNMVYEAEYKMKAHELSSLPKNYQLAAQIPFENKDGTCEMVHVEELIKVSIGDLPLIELPALNENFNILRPCSTPEPCTKHPCKFILPNEKSVTILPLTEIHKELAQYAQENEAQYVVTEKALKCLVEVDRRWMLPISVCQTIGPDGENINVVVMGNDFSVEKEASVIRTYKAFTHLLQFSLIPPMEKAKMLTRLGDPPPEKHAVVTHEVQELSSDDEDDDSLVIDTGDMQIKTEPTPQDIEMADGNTKEDTGQTNGIDRPQDSSTNEKQSGDEILHDIGIFTCSCKDSIFEKPPPRSFRKWRFQNKATQERFDVIVHCSHKVKTKAGEVVLETIPEYQLELGATRLSPHKVKALALSMLLRKNASVLTARIDGQSGEMVRYDTHTREEWRKLHGDRTADVAATIHATLSQLQGLLPGNYILQHEPSHGANGMLYAARGSGAGISLRFDCAALTPEEEAKSVKIPPELEPTLLPYHKFRSILPCAFTPFSNQVMREIKKPVPKKKGPPQAIKLDEDAIAESRSKWPKRKRKPKKSQHQ